MPRGKKKFKPQPQVSPVMAAATALVALNPAERALAQEIASHLLATQHKPYYVDPGVELPDPGAKAVLVNVGGAIANGKAHAAPAKRAIKRASKKRLANEPAAPIKEKSQLTLQFGKGKKSAAPASD